MTNYRNNPWRRSDGGMGDLLGAALIVLIFAGSLAYAVGGWVLIPIVLILLILSGMKL